MWRYKNILTTFAFSLITFQVSAQEFSYFQVTDWERIQLEYGVTDSLPGIGGPTNILDENPLYQQIINELGEEYVRIGERQAALALENRGIQVTGGLNSLGFTFKKDFIDFGTNFSRTLSPDLFDDKRWIVSDEFTITLDASKVLSNLRDKKIISITDHNLALFAGVSFKRVHRYVHFADSYNEGLVLNLNRLFMGFKAFKKRGFLEMMPYEFAVKEDFLSVKAGGLVSAPIWGPFAGSAGALGKYERMVRVELEALGAEDIPQDHEKFRINYEKTKSISLGASATLQADFLNILKLTILSFDFNYEYSDQYKYYLSFKDSDIPELMKDSSKAYVVDEMLKGRSPNLAVVAENLVSLERRQTERQKMKYSLLIYGGQREQATQSVQVSKDGLLKTFFRHNYEEIKYKEGLFSHLLGGLIRKILNLNSIVQKDASEVKRFRMEYESDKDLVATKNDLYFESNEDKENLSLSFKTEYMVADTLKVTSQKDKKKTLGVLNAYSGVDPLAISLFESNYLRGPARVMLDYKLGFEGISYLNNLSNPSLLKNIDETCQTESKTIFSFFRSLFSSCKNNLRKSYELYSIERRQNAITHANYTACQKQAKGLFRSARKERELLILCLEKVSMKSLDKQQNEIPLWRLKDFMQDLHKYSENKIDMYTYFGLSNTFMYGSFEAMTETNIPFTHHFNEGAFRGLGVIENALVKDRLRTPASVIIE